MAEVGRRICCCCMRWGWGCGGEEVGRFVGVFGCASCMLNSYGRLKWFEVDIEGLMV